MKTIDPRIALLVCLAAAAFQAPAAEIGIFDISKLEAVNVEPSVVTYQGRKALRLTAGAANEARLGGMAILKETEFGDGEIEIDLAGEPGPGAAAGARGFAGVAFRVAGKERFECVYLRPTNGRADDQVRRNHSVQYESLPDYPWSRLRKEEPEKYETYVDLQPGAWTRYRLVVSGTKARLYVHGAEQPTLVVNDLKLGASKGRIALWIGPGTVAHFANLRVK